MVKPTSPQLTNLGRQLGEYVRHQSENKFNLQALQGVIADLTSDKHDLQASLRDLVSRESFKSLLPYALSGYGTVKRDAVIQEISRVYHPEIIIEIEEVLNGFLAKNGGSASSVSRHSLPGHNSQSSAGIHEDSVDTSAAANTSNYSTIHTQTLSASSLSRFTVTALLGAILLLLFFVMHKQQAVIATNAIQSEDFRKQDPSRFNALADAKVDAAIYAVQEWVNAMSNMDDQRASRYMTGEAEEMYDPLFFKQFERVNVSKLAVDSISGSFVNLNGVMTFVYPDGSVQKETRTFTVYTKDGSAIVSNTEFGRVIQWR